MQMMDSSLILVMCGLNENEGSCIFFLKAFKNWKIKIYAINSWEKKIDRIYPNDHLAHLRKL